MARRKRAPAGLGLIATGGAIVCFHDRTECWFCWPSNGLPPPVRRPRLHCVTCGRFRKRSPSPMCPVCVERGFEALTLELLDSMVCSS